MYVSSRLARSALLPAAVLACRPSARLEGTYILQTIDGAPPPVTMSTYADNNQGQLIAANITFDGANRAIYKWQYRVLQPHGQVDTLQLAVDSFSVAHIGGEILLSRYSPVGPDSPDSLLQTDTAQILAEALILHDRSTISGGVRRHVLRFARQ
jgi:hypothetical protein